MKKMETKEQILEENLINILDPESLLDYSMLNPLPILLPKSNFPLPSEPFEVVPDQNEEISQDPHCLSYWEVPSSVCERYQERGIISLYDWQVECLQLKGVWKQGRNLVYSAPTSSGKTLVAELLMLRKVLQTKKKALFILPFVSVVAEKTLYFQDILKPLELKIQGKYANRGKIFEEDEIDIFVATIEKANSLVNRFLEEKKMDQLGIIIIDEIHMMSDRDRGYLLELLVTKILYHSSLSFQIVGLSATLPNIENFQRWLNAALYITHYRPVPLIEYIKIENKLYDKSFQIVRELIPQKYSFIDKDPEMIGLLIHEIVNENHSVLLFCATKKVCESEALRLSEILDESQDPTHSNARIKLLEDLKRTPGGLDLILEKVIPKGVGYHHAGLTIEEREIIEKGFRHGVLNTLCCTSTLAAGVNLPARRVIFKTPFVANDFLDYTRYKQMSGRAGRTGKDTVGESILIVQKHEAEAVKYLIGQDFSILESCLSKEKRGMKRPILEAIATEEVKTVYDIERFIRFTLFSAQKNYSEVHQETKSSLQFLEENDLIEWNSTHQKFISTKLGKATVASALSPEEGLIVFEELQKGRKNFVLDNELHLLFQVTPIFHTIEPNWNKFYSIYCQLDSEMRRVCELIGISEAFLVKASISAPFQNQDAVNKFIIQLFLNLLLSKNCSRHKRLYASLILFELVRETPFWKITEQFGIQRGPLQVLQTTASTFCGMVSIFCQKLGWWEMELLINQFSERLNFGVQMDILPLVQIPHIKGYQARALYDSGLTSITQIAFTSPEDIEHILHKLIPFKSKKASQGDFVKNYKRNESKAARLIAFGAKKLLEVQMKGTNTLENTLTLSGIKQTITPPKISPSKISLSSKNHSSLQRLGFEIIEISNSTLLTEFISIWDKKSSFAFTIHWLNSIYSNSSKPIYGNNIKHQLPLWPSFILEGISVCWGETVYYIPLMLSNLSAKASKTWNILSNIFTRDWNIKMGFDMKQTLSILLNFSTKLNGPIYDPKIAAWLLDPKDNSNECYNLEKLFSQYLPSSNISGFPENNIEMICKQTIQTWFLMNKLFDLLKLEQIEQVFLNIEMPLVSVIAEIEFWGIGFDADQCRKHLAYITQKIQDLEKEAHQLVHRPFNLNSAKEVGVILFDEIGLPSGRKIPGAKKHKFLKTDAQYDTSAQYLRTIQALHPLPGILIEYRRLQTLLEKYINILPKYLSFHTALETPRLLTNCLQTDSATGRIIFQNPNLQTIPHERIFSLSEVTISTSLRDAFIPKPGMIFLSADYSQLELCFMAHFSEDPILLNLLNTSDPLSHIASKWLKKDVMLITKTEREQCKAVTYGIFYGMGVRTISEKLNLPEDETEILLEQFKANFSKLMQFINNTVESCKTSGYIKTLYGRKRTFPEIYSKDQNEKCATERSVINTYCQGSAADVIKLAMINIHNRISEWKALQQLSMSFFNLEKEKDFPHLVLQMHDELLFEIPEPDLPIIQRIVQEEMENGFSLKVPLKVKMKCGKSWGALQSIPTKQTS